MPAKFSDPQWTSDGQSRAYVTLKELHTLWFNTGTLCNLSCQNCYIESSPRNDRLAYIGYDEIRQYLDEIATSGWNTQEIGLTGGEPFMNKEIIPILQLILERGFRVLVLTNAMRPMMRFSESLLALNRCFHSQLKIRVSVDHCDPLKHEEERGAKTWKVMMKGLCWLAEHQFQIDIAGRTRWGESEAELRLGYGRLFAQYQIPVDAEDSVQLMLFPEMDEQADVPEITTGCWKILGKNPDDIMCASSRMVIKRKGAARPAVVACTLLPYDTEFELGETLADAAQNIALNHPHCAKFCVLGGGACSRET